MALHASPQSPVLERTAVGTLDFMRVSDKGQVTIPKDLRDALGIGPGTELTFETDGETLIVRKAPEGPTRGELLARRLIGRGDGTMTTDEIMAMTRGE